MEREAASFDEQFRVFQSTIMPSKRGQACTSRHDVASQNIRIFSNLTSRLNTTNVIRHKSLLTPHPSPFNGVIPYALQTLTSYRPPSTTHSTNSTLILQHCKLRLTQNTLAMCINCRNYPVRNCSKRLMCLNKPYITARWQSADGAAVAPATTLPAPTALTHWDEDVTPGTRVRLHQT